MNAKTTMPLHEFVRWQLKDPTRHPLIKMSNSEAIITRSRRSGGHVTLWMYLRPMSADIDWQDLDEEFVLDLPYNFMITF